MLDDLILYTMLLSNFYPMKLKDSNYLHVFISKLEFRSHADDLDLHCFKNSALYSKTCVKQLSQKDQKLVFKTNYCFMKVKSIAECSKGSILQYF